MTAGQAILITGALLAVALGASLLAGRLRVPGLIAFLGIGMAVGSDGFGWIDFGDYEAARTVGIVCLALILFEGGLATRWDDMRPVLGSAVALATVGTILTAVLTGLAASWLLGLSTLEGMLVGSIIAGTDGAAIFAVLRRSTLRRRLARTLESEAGLNDPVAVLLVLGFVSWLTEPDYGIADMAVLLVRQLTIGVAAGVAVGAAGAWCLRRLRLGSAGLYPVASLAVGALAFGAADTLHGSGFLAVFLAGLIVGSADIPALRTITTFHDGMAWVAQLTMFLTLGLLVFPSQLDDVAAKGTLLAIIAAAIARPAAVLGVLAPFRYSAPERLVIGWAGLRGAVPVVLATFPVIAGVSDATSLFDVVFFAVVISTILQGATFEPFARRLGVSTERQARPDPLLEAGAVRRLGAEVAQFAVRDGDAIVGLRVRELGLPRDALLNLVVRDGRAIPPRGSTEVLAGDHLHVLVRQEAAIEFEALLRRWRSGPMAVRAPRRVGTRGRAIFTSGPWRGEGDPGRPEQVHGVDVVEQLRTRRDEPGALVALEDGRYAFTGRIVAAGSARQLRAAARRRLRYATADSERAWWRELIGALSAARD